MKENYQRLLVILILVVILFSTGTALLAAQAPSAKGSLARQPACYTIDTSRPEWLSAQVFIYLPLVLKSFGP